MKIRKITILFTFLAARSLLSAQGNIPQMEIDNNKHPISVPNHYNDWPTLISKLTGMSFPIGGESLTGLGFNRRYTKEEIKESPFIKWLLEEALINEEIVNQCFDKNKNDNGTHTHALGFFTDPRIGSHLARFNEVTKARILAKELASAQKENIDAEARVLDRKNQIAIQENEIVDKNIKLAQTRKGLLLFSFPLLFFGFFCYGFLLPIFRALAPDLTPSAIAETNILTTNQKVLRALLIPWIINKLSFGRYFSDSFSHASKETLPKGHYRSKNEVELESYNKSIKSWSKQEIPVVSNLLLIGPPGVGKTMFAKNLFLLDDISFIQTNSQFLLSMLDQQGTEMVVKELRKIFDFAKSHNKKTGRKVIIFIDEADKLGGHINAILGLLDSDFGKDIVFVLACNDKTVLPDPILSRFRKQISIHPPNQAAAHALLVEYMTLIGKQYPRVIFPKKNKQLIDSLAASLAKKGTTGRAIQGAMFEIANLVSARPKKQVTREDLEMVFNISLKPKTTTTNRLY